ncbi:MAG: multidrug efflux SMR transporter [Candidatus Obscuribacterales bacterium]|nr:multidrug efflux SMR transporter [Candidatus Obscuribacterales bacterium]
MSWLYLFFAGLFEIGWAVGFKLGASPAKPGWLALTIVSLILSMVLLALAMKELPFGTAYAVWTGIGVAGTFIIGLCCFSDPVNPLRLVSFVFLLLGLIGLKLAS